MSDENIFDDDRDDNDDDMLPELGNGEYLSGTEAFVERSSSPARETAAIPLGLPFTHTPPSRISAIGSSSIRPCVNKSYRPPLATIYPSTPVPSTTSRSDNVTHTLVGHARSVAVLALLATVRYQVQQWCYGWGPPRRWSVPLATGLHAAILNNSLWAWEEELQVHVSAGRKLVDAMHGVMDGELPTEEWLYRDLWRQAVELLSTLHEGIACLEAHIALVIPPASVRIGA